MFVARGVSSRESKNIEVVVHARCICTHSDIVSDM